MEPKTSAASVPKAGACRTHLGSHVGQTGAVRSFHQVLLDPRGCRRKVQGTRQNRRRRWQEGKSGGPGPWGDWPLRLRSPAGDEEVQAVTRHGAHLASPLNKEKQVRKFRRGGVWQERGDCVYHTCLLNTSKKKLRQGGPKRWTSAGPGRGRDATEPPGISSCAWVEDSRTARMLSISPSW